MNNFKFLIFNFKSNIKSSMLKKRTYGKLFGYLLIGLFVYWIITKQSFAQTPAPQGLDLTVSPPSIELNAKPGDTIKEKFRIRNNRNTPISLGIQVKKLSSSELDGEPMPAEVGPEDEFIQWLTLDESTFTARPNEWKDITFTIAIPDTAAYGYYYAFRIAPTDEKTVTGTGTTVKGEILIVTLLNVKKDGARAVGEIVEFKPNKFVSEYVPIEFTTRIANKGNVHIKPRGNILIIGASKKDIAIREVNQGLGNVLPSGKRTFTSSWNDGFIVKEPVMEGNVPKLDEKGEQITKLSINWNKLTHFRMGKYTASLLMVYDDGKRDATIESVATFWLIPYTAIAVIIVSLVALVIIVRFLLKWYINREVRRVRGK